MSLFIVLIRTGWILANRVGLISILGQLSSQEKGVVIHSICQYSDCQSHFLKRTRVLSVIGHLSYSSNETH